MMSSHLTSSHRYGSTPNDHPGSPSWWSAPDDCELVDRAVARFRRAFGHEPDGVFSAPGRVNLLGEHIDYSGGTVLPLALPHRTAVAVAHRKDDIVRAVSGQEEGTREVSLSAVGPAGSPQAVSGWLAYVAGVPWAMRAEGMTDTFVGMDIAVESAVPVGAGLSSSAALECAVALAADSGTHAERGNGSFPVVSDERRARLVRACIRAENEIAGASTGGMDQSIALRAQEGSVLSIDCRDFSVAPVHIDMASAGLTLLVIDTRAPHRLVDGQYAARRAGCDAAAALLGADSLREALEGAPDHRTVLSALGRFDIAVSENPLAGDQDAAVVRRLVHHAWTEMARVQECMDLFRSAKQAPDDTVWARLGSLLNASHESLRDDYVVSSPELDLAVDAARTHGALGARMTGGGFGGSAIALVPSKSVDAVALAIAEAFSMAGLPAPQFLAAAPSGPARRDR